MTLEEEEWIFEMFVRLHPDVYRKDFKKTESPDFTLQLEEKIIGVELTEIFQDSTDKDSKLQKKSSDGISFTEDFIKEIQPNIPFKFAVNFHFSRFHPIRKFERQNLIKEISKICIPSLIRLHNKEFLDFDYYNGIPEQIDLIQFSRYDALNESYNSRSEGGIVRSLTSEPLQKVINKKEKKLRNYSPCDEYWLVIREGNYYAGSFSDDIDEEITVKSNFDRIFLLRTKKEELIILK